MIDATTGYIRHQDWGENTDREMQRALNDLRSKGMKRLLFDIRGNPGGPLDQAIKVSNEFLPKGKMIVYTRGRVRNSDQDYRATEDSTFLDIPMVVLANRNSASASEIVTGALQDHDRAYIVGETTFGKALVQSVYPISDGAGLALTTAHYFTPSGRLIQRPWDETFDEYLSYTQKDQDAHQAAQPERSRSAPTPGDRCTAAAASSRTSTSPGTLEGFNPTPFGRALYGRQEFETYAQKFTAEGDTRIPQAAGQGLGRGEAELRRRRPDAGGLPRAAGGEPREDRRGRVREGPGLHQGHDPLPHRRGGVRHRRGPAAHGRGRSAGAGGPGLFGEAEKLAGLVHKADVQSRARVGAARRRSIDHNEWGCSLPLPQ